MLTNIQYILFIVVYVLCTNSNQSVNLKLIINQSKEFFILNIETFQKMQIDVACELWWLITYRLGIWSIIGWAAMYSTQKQLSKNEALCKNVPIKCFIKIIQSFKWLHELGWMAVWLLGRLSQYSTRQYCQCLLPGSLCSLLWSLILMTFNKLQVWIVIKIMVKKFLVSITILIVRYLKTSNKDDRRLDNPPVIELPRRWDESEKAQRGLSPLKRVQFLYLQNPKNLSYLEPS